MTHIYIPKSSDMWCIHYHGSTEVNMHLDFLGPLTILSLDVIECAKRRDPVMPMLMRLHWLPVEKRIVYKIVLLYVPQSSNS